MDLTKEIDDTIFNIRVAGLIRYQNKILLSKNKNKDYYTIPGGRVKLKEDSKSALIRELKEELNYDLTLDDLRIVRTVENFFKENNKFYHEYLFIYEINLDDKYYNGNFTNIENENTTMKWIDETNFILLDVYPGLIKGILSDNNYKHLIYKQEQ